MFVKQTDGDPVWGSCAVDFNGSLHFVNAVGEAANKANHHPDIMIQWNRVTLTLSSHDAGGLTQRDFDLAKSIDALADPG